MVWSDPAVVRFGIAECQYGPQEIAACGVPPPRCPPTAATCARRSRPYGPDLVVATLEFANGEVPGRGRQSQVWARTPDGLRVPAPCPRLHDRLTPDPASPPSSQVAHQGADSATR